MKNAISFQLSEFRSWTNGKEGCLFYLSNYKKKPPYTNAIVLIESQWRKEDDIGSFDNLHAVEWNRIDDDNFIAQGYAAFILKHLICQSRGMHSDILGEDERDMDGETTSCRIWEEYCDRYRKTLFERHLEDMIKQEAYALFNTKWEIISDYLPTPKDDIGWLLAVPVSEWLCDPKVRYGELAKEIQIKLSLPELFTSSIRMNGNTLVNNWGDKLLFGIKAFIAQAAVADSIASDFENTFPDHCFEALNKLVSRIWGFPPLYDRTLKYSEIKIRPQNEIRNIFETYTDMMIPFCHSQIRMLYPTYAILEDDQKDAKALAYLFTNEWEYAKTDSDFEKQLNRKDRQRIKVATRYFFKYLLRRLKRFDEEYKTCYQLIYPKNESGTIPEKEQPFCTYTVPNALKTREEVECDLVRSSQKSASTFARLLKAYEKQGYLDFRGEDPSEIFEYMQKRYDITKYQSGNFCRYFK